MLSLQPLKQALEMIPFDGNGTTPFAAVSYLLAVSKSIGKNTTEQLEGLQICETALRRKPTDYLLYLARYVQWNPS